MQPEAARVAPRVHRPEQFLAGGIDECHGVELDAD